MKIIVANEKEKQELLRTCKYLHDFSVMFWNLRKRNRVEIWRSLDGSIPKERVYPKKHCGVSLDHDESFPLLGLLVGLHDADDDVREDVINETVIIQDHKNKYQFEVPPEKGK